MDHFKGRRPVFDIGQGLGGEDHRGVLLAQGLQPLPQLGAEAGVVEREPAFVHDDQGGASVQTRLDAMEEMGEHGGGCRRSDEAFGLERLDRAGSEVFVVAVKQPPPGAFQGEGGDGALHQAALNEGGEPRKRPFGGRRPGQAGQGRPDLFADLWVDRDAFALEEGDQPGLGPGPFAGIIDAFERLEGQAATFAGQGVTEVMEVSAHGQGRSPDGAAVVEGEDLGGPIASKLQGHQGQEHALAGAGRADHQGVTDVADMMGKAEGRRALCSRLEERRPVEVRIPVRAGPYRGHRDDVREIERRDRRGPYIGVEVAGQSAEPGLHGVQVLDDAGEVATLDGFLRLTELGVGDRRVLIPDGYGCLLYTSPSPRDS